MRPRFVHPAILLTLALPSACADDTELPAASDTTGDDTASTAAVDDTTDAAVDPSPTGDTSGATAGGLEGSTSDGTTEGGEGPMLECEAGAATLSGELDGIPVEASLALDGVGWISMGVELAFGSLGRIYLRLPGLEDIGGTVPMAGPGYLRMPEDGPEAQTWYCAGETSEYVSDGAFVYAATLDDVRRLGACGEGTPVAGGATICFGGPECGGTRAFVSEIEGASFTSPLGKGLLISGLIGSNTLEIQGEIGEVDGGVFVVRANGLQYRATKPATATVDVAYFIVPFGQPDGGAVYCGEVATTLDYAAVGPEDIVPRAIHFDGLTRLGSCDEAVGRPGSIDLCMNMEL